MRDSSLAQIRPMESPPRFLHLPLLSVPLHVASVLVALGSASHTVYTPASLGPTLHVVLQAPSAA